MAVSNSWALVLTGSVRRSKHLISWQKISQKVFRVNFHISLKLKETIWITSIIPKTYLSIQ